MEKFIIALCIIGSTIIGNISDNKENLTGVKVSTKNEIIYTDFDGNFKINISDTLWIEFISYEDSIIVLKDSLIAKF